MHHSIFGYNPEGTFIDISTSSALRNLSRKAAVSDFLEDSQSRDATVSLEKVLHDAATYSPIDLGNPKVKRIVLAHLSTCYAETYRVLQNAPIPLNAISSRISIFEEFGTHHLGSQGVDSYWIGIFLGSTNLLRSGEDLLDIFKELPRLFSGDFYDFMVMECEKIVISTVAFRFGVNTRFLKIDSRNTHIDRSRRLC